MPIRPDDVTPPGLAPARRFRALPGRAGSGRLDLDLDVHAGREVEPLERVDRLGRVLDDVPVSYTHLDVYKRQVWMARFMARRKATRNRRTNVRGRRPNSKRAIVTLHPDDSIDLFDR